jgi:hypothetical protein
MTFSHLLPFLLILSLTFYSCSGTETVTKQNEVATSPYPSWFNANGVASDSTHLQVFAVSLAADSLDALQRAESASLRDLDLYIGEISESIRSEMDRNEVEGARSVSVVRTIRSISQECTTASVLANTEVQFINGAYRAFASHKIRKADIISVYSDAFADKNQFFMSFKDTGSFQTHFGTY